MRASLLALAAGLLIGAPLHASDITEGEALVKKSGCLACHQATRKVIGPAYVDVAKKYKGKAGIKAQLVQKVKKGGSGNWGQVPMTPHPQLAESDIAKMVTWVLAGAPSSAPVAKAAPTAAPKAAAKEDPKADDGGMPQRKKKKGHTMLPHSGHGKKAELAWATDEQVRDLMTGQDCFGCHSGINSVDEPVAKPWPSFKQIETRYRSSGDVAALVKKVQENQGARKWGSLPHPTYPGLPTEAVDATVRYVLAGKASQMAVAAGADMGAEEWMKTRSDCFTCHQVSAKVIGPAYRDVAKKYGVKDVAMLVKKVKQGGAGNWGNVPMTAHATASDEMVEKAVRWILTQK